MAAEDWPALIIAATGAAGTYTAYRLGKRGQNNDEKQQHAATKLQERIAAFDELESLNDRLATENTRLRDLYAEAETRGDARLAVQARRCREQLEQSMAAMVTLQSVVLSEVARVASSDTAEQARRHIEEEHPDLD